MIISWATLKDKFKENFKPTKDKHAFLAQLTQMKKNTYEGMHKFIPKFNKLVNRIPTSSQPTTKNIKCFFINTQLPEVSFLLRWASPIDLAAIQTMATQIEDHLILA